jgi:hypothetical protein
MDVHVLADRFQFGDSLAFCLSLGISVHDPGKAIVFQVGDQGNEKPVDAIKDVLTGWLALAQPDDLPFLQSQVVSIAYDIASRLRSMDRQGRSETPASTPDVPPASVQHRS